MENNNQDDGLTLGEIFGVLLKRKWILLIGTIAITIIGILFFSFIYNKGATSYTVKFEYDFPGYEQEKYPNGKKFNYTSIIEMENLNKIKDSNIEYASIDIEKMNDENDITIAKNYEKEVFDGTYTLSVKKKYFKSTTVAKSFLSSVIKYPIDYTLDTVNLINYSSNLYAFNHANTYEAQLDNLKAQTDLLLNGYGTLISSYSGSYIVKDKALTDYLLDVQIIAKNNPISTLYVELETNGYVKESEGYLDTIQAELELLRTELVLNEKTIIALREELRELASITNSNTSSIQIFESFNERIADLIVRNTKIARDMEILESYIKTIQSSDTGSVVFDKKLETYYNDLEAMTTIYKDVVVTLYNDVSKVHYTDNSVLITEGGISMLIGGAVSLVLGLVGSCCVVLILDLPKYNKNKKTEVEENQAS